MAKEHILLVVRPAAGGIREHLRSLITHLAADFTFTVTCPQEQRLDYEDLPCQILALPLTGTLTPLSDLRAMRRLVQYIRASSVQMLHAHGFKAALLARPAARFCKLPCLVTLHSDFAQAQATRLSGVYLAVERSLSHWTTGYITVSHWLANKLEQSLQVNQGQITIVPNGIELTARGAAKIITLPFTEDTVVVGSVARLVPQKGLEVLLQAAAILTPRFPQVRFVVAGEGPLRAQLEIVRKNLGLEKYFFFLGHCEQVPALLSRLSVFVLPSLSEAQGIAVLEAMQAGRPVVVSAVGGLSELVEHNKNGLLVPPGKADLLAEAIEKLLLQPQLAARLAQQAQADVSRFNIVESMRRTKLVYDRVLEGRYAL